MLQQFKGIPWGVYIKLQSPYPSLPSSLSRYLGWVIAKGGVWGGDYLQFIFFLIILFFLKPWLHEDYANV